LNYLLEKTKVHGMSPRINSALNEHQYIFIPTVLQPQAFLK